MLRLRNGSGEKMVKTQIGGKDATGKTAGSTRDGRTQADDAGLEPSGETLFDVQACAAAAAAAAAAAGDGEARRAEDRQTLRRVVRTELGRRRPARKHDRHQGRGAAARRALVRRPGALDPQHRLRHADGEHAGPDGAAAEAVSLLLAVRGRGDLQQHDTVPGQEPRRVFPQVRGRGGGVRTAPAGGVGGDAGALGPAPAGRQRGPRAGQEAPGRQEEQSQEAQHGRLLRYVEK